jgi:hypothetical protein
VDENEDEMGNDGWGGKGERGSRIPPDPSVLSVGSQFRTILISTALCPSLWVADNSNPFSFATVPDDVPLGAAPQWFETDDSGQAELAVKQELAVVGQIVAGMSSAQLVSGRIHLLIQFSKGYEEEEAGPWPMRSKRRQACKGSGGCCGCCDC